MRSVDIYLLNILCSKDILLEFGLLPCKVILKFDDSRADARLINRSYSNPFT